MKVTYRNWRDIDYAELRSISDSDMVKFFHHLSVFSTNFVICYGASFIWNWGDTSVSIEKSADRVIIYLNEELVAGYQFTIFRGAIELYPSMVPPSNGFSTSEELMMNTLNEFMDTWGRL